MIHSSPAIQKMRRLPPLRPSTVICTVQNFIGKSQGLPEDDGGVILARSYYCCCWHMLSSRETLSFKCREMNAAFIVLTPFTPNMHLDQQHEKINHTDSNTTWVFSLYLQHGGLCVSLCYNFPACSQPSTNLNFKFVFFFTVQVPFLIDTHR